MHNIDNLNEIKYHMQQRIIAFIHAMKELAIRYNQPEIANIPEYVNNSQSLLQLMWKNHIESQNNCVQIQELVSECPAAQKALDTKIRELENNGISGSIYHIAGCRAPKRQKTYATRTPGTPMRTLNF